MPIIYSDGLINEEIVDIEIKYRLKFPEEYRLFLSNYNGCRITAPSYCDLSFHGVDDGSIAFDALFSANSDNENFCLQYMNDEYLAELEHIKHSFLIGSDPGDNFYFLVTEGDKNGIYYWDRAGVHSEDPDGKQNIYKIYDKFDVFFKMILSSINELR